MLPIESAEEEEKEGKEGNIARKLKTETNLEGEVEGGVQGFNSWQRETD